MTNVYAQCSIDYDPGSPTTQIFYKFVQNKLHWAITGHTAAELIAERANATQPNMGLTTWKNAPKGKILKTDVSIAKNYLSEQELELNRIVSIILKDAGHINAEIARQLAETQFEQYRVLQDKTYESDFDEAIKRLEK